MQKQNLQANIRCGATLRCIVASWLSCTNPMARVCGQCGQCGHWCCTITIGEPGFAMVTMVEWFVYLAHEKAGVQECRMGAVIVGVHRTFRIETAEQFAGYLLLNVKHHVQNILSAHRAFQVVAAGLKTDFSLGPAMVTLVLRVTAAEEDAVVVQRETLGAEEGDELAVVPVAADHPARCQVGVNSADHIVAVSLAGLVFHQASVWSQVKEGASHASVAKKCN